MGNKLKGQVTFEAQGKTWCLEFTPNAFCALEDATGKGAMAFIAGLERAATDLHVSDVRVLFWAGLADGAPDLTLQQAGGLMRDLGGMTGAMALVERALGLAMPDADAGKAEKPGKTPGKTGASRRK